MYKIILTGGNEGIGYYMTLQFLEDGNQVSVIDVNNNNLLLLKEKFPKDLLINICDVSRAEEVNDSVKNTFNHFGGIDLAIHNACLCLFTSLEDTKVEEYKRVFDVNYYGAINITKTVLPVMKEQGHGKIFFTSSGVGVMGFVNISAYASSKGAIESLAKCLNIEYLNTNISFHILHPPLTKTTSASLLPVPDEFKADPEKVGRGLAKRINMKRFIICHSYMQTLQTKMAYRYPLTLGKFMSKMTLNYHKKER